MAAVRALLARDAGATLEFLGSVATDLFWQNDATREQISGSVGLKGTGKLHLGPTGVTASEITRVVQLDGQVPMKQEAAKGDAYFAGLLESAGTTRMISTKGRLYHLPPKTRTWLRTGRAGGGAAAYGDQIINVLEPATLAKLLSTADRSSVTPWYENRTTGRRGSAVYRMWSTTFRRVVRHGPGSPAWEWLHWMAERRIVSALPSPLLSELVEPNQMAAAFGTFSTARSLP